MALSGRGKGARSSAPNKSKKKKICKKTVTFYMDEDYYQKLQNIADRSRVTRSHLMRQALMRFVDEIEDSQGKIF